MRERLHFWVAGGDPRQAALANSLYEDGHTVHAYALEQGVGSSLCVPDTAGLKQADCVILPLPAVEGEFLNAPLTSRQIPISEILDTMHPGQLLCAGRVSETLSQLAQERKLRLVDYFAREELAVANAVPGALAVWLCRKARANEIVRQSPSHLLSNSFSTGTNQQFMSNLLSVRISWI